ncbi:MAG: FtsX-like permease family protein [Cytophagales bacterium]|nr:MAG: FtsX-like permease family protein [Cytophagales bacterium]
MPVKKPTNTKKKKLGSYPAFTVVFSITISLFVIGLFAMLVLHANKLSELIKENVELHVYLKKDVSNTKIDSIKNIIGKMPFVMKKNMAAQIVHINKEEAAKKFITDTGEDFSHVLEDNPLRESLVIKINKNYFEKDKLAQAVEKIKIIPEVFEVSYPINLVSEINTNVKLIGLVLIFFAIILLLTTVLLIRNTIKLALYSQRFLIRSMQLVGAKSSFIQRPFLWHATVQGFFSGLIAVFILIGLLQYGYNEIPQLDRLKEIEKILIAFGGIIFAGMLIGLLSSYQAVRKYLRMSLDDLY